MSYNRDSGHDCRNCSEEYCNEADEAPAFGIHAGCLLEYEK